jgi:hypothetical protein
MILRILTGSVFGIFWLKCMRADRISLCDRIFTKNTIWMQIALHTLAFANINNVRFHYCCSPIFIFSNAIIAKLCASDDLQELVKEVP